MTVAGPKVSEQQYTRPPSLSDGKLPRSRSLGLALSGGILAMSGLTMVVFRYVIPSHDPFSAYPHALWPWLLAFHVFPIPIFAFYVGSIWWHHVVRHWSAHTRRLTGVIVVVCMALLGVSGFLLYFVGSETLLRAGRVSHASLGTLGFLVYGLHVVLGWRALRRDRAASGHAG